MSLVRPAWLYVAFMIGLVSASLWFFLRPQEDLAERASPIPEVSTTLANGSAVDLAVSSGLFSESGAPIANAASAADAASPSASPPRLVGIAIKARGNAVALAVDANGATHLMRPGEALDGWTLASLSKSSADFTRGVDKQSVVLGQAKANEAGPQSAGTTVASASTNKQTGSVP